MSYLPENEKELKALLAKYVLDMYELQKLRKRIDNRTQGKERVVLKEPLRRGADIYFGIEPKQMDPEETKEKISDRVLGILDSYGDSLDKLNYQDVADEVASALLDEIRESQRVQ